MANVMSLPAAVFSIPARKLRSYNTMKFFLQCNSDTGRRYLRSQSDETTSMVFCEHFSRQKGKLTTTEGACGSDWQIFMRFCRSLQAYLVTKTGRNTMKYLIL